MEFTAEVKGDVKPLLEQFYEGEMSVYADFADGGEMEVALIRRAPDCPIEIYKAFLQSLMK